MSNEMKIIMENWRDNIILEQKAMQIHNQLIEEFVKEIKHLTENKAELNEIFSKIGEFAKKAYNSYSEIKTGLIEKILTAGINAILKLLPLVKEKAPNIVSKLERVLNDLKKTENMTVAVSIISILAGLITGEAFDAIGEVLKAISSAPNILKAYEIIKNINDMVDVKKVIDKTGKLVDAAVVAQ